MHSDSFLIQMPSVDTYFICQVIDNTMKGGMDWARNIEDFMGDMRCSLLIRNYPKYTPLHDYIEFVVSSIIWEEMEKGIDDGSDIFPYSSGSSLWVDKLLAAHGFSMSAQNWRKFTSKPKWAENYLEFLNDEGIMEELLEQIAKEVFHVIFSNRKLLKNFASTASYYVLETVPAFHPEALTNKGYLYRATIPQWAKNAVFHRDKGICTSCNTNLSNLINQQGKLHFDHVIPLAKGGMNDVTNLQLLCERCNCSKSSKITKSAFNYETWYKY